MANINNKERVEILSRDALAWLHLRNILPTPVNYELAYSLVSPQFADLKRAMDTQIGDGGNFEPAVVETFCECFVRIQRECGVVTEARENLGDAFVTFLGMMGSVRLGHGNHGRSHLAASSERTIAPAEQLGGHLPETNDLYGRLGPVRQDVLSDDLTGIANRTSFDGSLKETIERVHERRDPLCLLMVDIDHLNKFNEAWGYQTGNEALRLVANFLSKNVKNTDTPSRIGGDVFGVILPQTPLTDAITLGDKIRRKLESKKIVNKNTGKVLGSITASMGVSLSHLGCCRFS